MRHTVLVLLAVVAVSLTAPFLADVDSAGSGQLAEQPRYGPFFDPDGHL